LLATCSYITYGYDIQKEQLNKQNTGQSDRKIPIPIEPYTVRDTDPNTC